MATASLSPQTSLQIFLALKAEMEIEKQSLQASELSFRQKLGNPAPSASNPVLQPTLNKAYKTYLKIIHAIINTYQEIGELCQNQIAFLDHAVNQTSTLQINVNVSRILEILRSQIEPLEDQFLQLQRTLQVEEAAMILLANEEGRI